MTSNVDLIIGNGIVHTVDPSLPRAQAVAISRGAIVAAGTDAEIRDLAGAGTESIDLAGRLLLPGFQDAHVHPSGGGMERRKCDLSEAHALEDYLRLIATYAESHPDEEWITGGGWSMDVFPGGVPSRADLDRVVPDRPVYLSNRDHHGAWVNTVALERAGITRTTPDPAGGRIDRDSHGEPVGALQEGAMDLVSGLMPAASREEIATSILEGQRYLHSYGITAWQEAIVGEYAVMPDCFDAYVDLDRSGQLTGRVVGALWWDRAAGMRQLDHLLARRERAATNRFRATSVKFMQDGVCENFTAAMLTPYLDVHGHETHNHGTSFVDAEELKEFVTAVDREGFQAHFHAIGDRAVREVLDAVEAARDANGASDNRHCVAHIQVVHPTDIPRFGALGVLANAQPLWACNEPQMITLTTPFLGEERAATQYPFASLARSGARLCFGSDWPVSTPNPLAEMHVAVNRTEPPGHQYGGGAVDAEPLRPSERLDIGAAIEAFTMGSAYLNHLDAVTGSITVGKRADLAVLDQDVTSIPVGDIGRVAVDMTLVDGRVVYERGAG